jgi:hypothetical protein
MEHGQGRGQRVDSREGGGWREWKMEWTVKRVEGGQGRGWRTDSGKDRRWITERTG